MESLLFLSDCFSRFNGRVGRLIWLAMDISAAVSRMRQPCRRATGERLCPAAVRAPLGMRPEALDADPKRVSVCKGSLRSHAEVEGGILP